MEWTNSRGVRWYLHMKETIIGRNKALVKTYFFVKDKNGTGIPVSLPIGRTVVETPNGLPFVKKL